MRNKKVRLLLYFLLLLGLFGFTNCCPLPNHTTPIQIHDNATIAHQPAPAVVDLLKLIPDLKTDVRYATANNFTEQVLYESATPYLVAEAAESLVVIQKKLREMGLQLVVFDGYRPLSVQKKMWAVYPDSRFVANPANGSRHNRGCAVDLSLADSSGRFLEMPTDYDDFTEKANASYMDLPAAALEHRAILKQVMERHGFIGLNSEWWHFDFQGWQDYPLLDTPIQPSD